MISEALNRDNNHNGMTENWIDINTTTTLINSIIYLTKGMMYNIYEYEYGYKYDNNEWI